MIAILLLFKIRGVSKQFLLNTYVSLQSIDLCASGKKTSRKRTLFVVKMHLTKRPPCVTLDQEHSGWGFEVLLHVSTRPKRPPLC